LIWGEQCVVFEVIAQASGAIRHQFLVASAPATPIRQLRTCKDELAGDLKVAKIDQVV
jgi:hypothetical protein